MNRKAILAAILVLLVLLYVSILSDSVPAATAQKKACVDLCSTISQRGETWYAGMCLAEAGQNGMAENWVCDVAHNPRQDVDNLKENQCATYGRAGKHFVEVDTECRFIRAV